MVLDLVVGIYGRFYRRGLRGRRRRGRELGRVRGPARKSRFHLQEEVENMGRTMAQAIEERAEARGIALGEARTGKHAAWRL